MTQWLIWWWLVAFMSLILSNMSEKPRWKDKCKIRHGFQCPRKDRIARCTENRCNSARKVAMGCMEEINNLWSNGSDSNTESILLLEKVLEETALEGSGPISSGKFLAYLYKPTGSFKGLNIYADETEARSDDTLPIKKLRARFPKEVEPGPNNTVVFCAFELPDNQLLFPDAYEIYERRMIGLSVRDKKISGLKERINFTLTLTEEVKKDHNLSCQFYNFSSKGFSEDGCTTEWERGQSEVTCSCDHLTYFSVLLVPTDGDKNHQEILRYISLIGCSLSLFALVITVVLFFANRKIREDVSMKVHINLVVALILLNLHFLPNQKIAELSIPELCYYMALALHYSLLATFTWMALEGFHLYLLLVKVFNIYIRRYLLKLSVVGWGVPAIIVSLVVIIKRDIYGLVFMDSSNSNDTAMCYIKDDTVKITTMVGFFSLVFLFNMSVLGVTVRQVLCLHQSQKYGPTECSRVKRNICTLLGLITLLGMTWGMVFFLFGPLSTPFLYLFCILNSLQGFFIFLWFVMSLKKTKQSANEKSSETRSTNN
ncbi:adhesion G-protein coupled receptor G1 [Pholidichthys leucotaenia]